MRLEDYRAFTATLTANLSSDPRVLGLIALGSMAEQNYLPDRWSDHDFFVVTLPGAQETFRTDLSWLPNHRQLAFWFRETPHALRAVYAGRHLLEFVLFDEAEPTLRRVLPDFEEQAITVTRRYLTSYAGE